MPDAVGGYGSEQRTKIIRMCEKHWDKWKGDCSGFVQAVAAEFGFALSQPANRMCEEIQKTPWTKIGQGSHASMIAGIMAGQEGKLVVGAWKHPKEGHGHVAIIVDFRGSWYTDERIRHRSVGYWGQFGGQGKKYSRTDKESWGADKLKDVVYSYVAIG